ncbi:hypothetical protein [Foetidibacter luteolus]|uniref:hypothetical protein n=1 Tax=Foetidibacter luteolus TaxID=2608880 RepID=UPI00129B544C|nr:hypothetical protein [Foetidibacter luteolus]
MPAQFIQHFHLEYSVIPVPDSVQLLKPSIFKHGDEWCASHISGEHPNIVVYAETPELAMLAFDRMFMSVALVHD